MQLPRARSRWSRKTSLAPLLVALAALAAGCGAEPSEPDEAAPGALLRAAIEAHGGATALTRLDDLRVRSETVFRDGVELERRIDLRAPDAFAMTLSREGREVAAFGVAGDRCWQRHGPFAHACSDEQRADHTLTLRVLDARLLHRIDPGAVTAEAPVTVDGRAHPAVRADDLRLAFDPETHRLARVDYADVEPRVEAFSDYVEIEGAWIARERSLEIDGEPDVTERWVEIEAGGADDSRLAPLSPSAPGDVYVGGEAERTVAWLELDDAEGDLAAARRDLEAFVEARGARPSGTDGLVVTEIEGGARVAIAIEQTRRFEDVDAAPYHLVTLPARDHVGVFHRGPDPARQAAALAAALSELGVRAVDGATPELLLVPGAEEAPLDERFGLYRVAVTR